MDTSPRTRFDLKVAKTLAKEVSPLVTAQNDFGRRLAMRLQGSNEPTKNLLISPTSIWQALALTAGGAKGETKTQLGMLLASGKLPDDKIGLGNRAFNTLLAEQKGASISVANSVWFADTFKPNPTFVKDVGANFGAGVELFPATNPAQGAARINDWVSQQTRKEITQIVQKGNVEDQSALLVNAVYFRGGWENKFDKDQTKPAPFHLSNGTTIEVPMMNGTKAHSYLSGNSFEGVRLSYENTNCALWVLLPKEGKMLGDVLSEVGSEKTKYLQAHGSVMVSLPRFDIEWREDLVEDLAAMKTPLPFSARADFGAMGQPIGGISAVLHVCKMRVDEEGTVAAAGTAVLMPRSAARRTEEPKVIKFDRPFVVALVEETSGARLFEGVVNAPSAAK